MPLRLDGFSQLCEENNILLLGLDLDPNQKFGHEMDTNKDRLAMLIVTLTPPWIILPRLFELETVIAMILVADPG